MKKSKLTLGVCFSALACTMLAGCNEVKYSSKGYILTYTNSAGETTHYTAEDLFGSYYEDSSKVSTMFDSVYKLIVRNYFTKENAGAAKYSEILKNAKIDVEGIKSKAQENADTNKTSYDDEWNALLQSYSCDDENELLEHFIYERELKEFNEQFYDNHIEDLRDSKPTTEDPDDYEGYIYKKAPYHVRHILVKVSESSTTNYWNSTIDAANAISLADVAEELAAGTKSFGKISSEYSSDKDQLNYGDLGIMDKDTTYVNEFQLGIYAYENIYNNATKAAAKDSTIAIDADIQTAYKAATEVGDKINKIPYGVFTKLREINDVTKDDLNRDVNDGNANFYPRNVYYNNYLNKHSLSVITADKVTGQTEDYSTLPGFNVADKYGDGLGNVLRTTDGLPVLVASAGTSDYRGIHFITVQRTPLIDEVNKVKVSEYYTTKYPGQEGYPEDESGNDKQTYVNFLDQEKKEYKSRAETVENKIKNFDKDLNKYIFVSYMAEQKIHFNDEKLEKALTKWVENAKVKSDYDEYLAWQKKWEGYIETLSVQNAERTKLIPETCAISFKSHTGADWEEGGVCYGNKN